MAMRRAVNALWPIGAGLIPEEQLRRSAAEYLLNCFWWDDEDLLDAPMAYTALLSAVGEHLASHPARAAYTGKLTTLFDRSQYFQRSRWGELDLLSLDEQAVCSPSTHSTAQAAAPAARAFALPATHLSAQSTAVELPSPFLGISQVEVRLRYLTTVSQADMQWLLDAQHLDHQLQEELCLGFNTEFRAGRLALIQLGNAERVLLIRVPFSSQTMPVPTCLAELLASPLILKAAAEAWQDVLMVYHSLGIRVAGGVCLTAALASLFPDSKPSLFTMMHNIFPSCGLESEAVALTSDWFANALNQEQLQHAALDAFISWAVAAGERDLVDQVRWLVFSLVVCCHAPLESLRCMVLGCGRP